MATFSSITHSENSKRKSHRVTVPIGAIINNQSYTVSNWSMHGMKIVKNQNAPELALLIGDILEVKLILPTGHSSIMLDMEVTIQNISADSYGMKITNINDKNKRVLRHYATLAIDGNIDHVDDLSGSLFMMNVASPIKEPIHMSDKEYKEVHQSFLRRVGVYLIVGILFVVVLSGVIAYNYTVIYNSSGLIAGNSSIYFAPYEGLIKDIYVSQGNHVAKDEVLFEMRDEEYGQQLNVLQKTQSLLTKQLQVFEDDLKNYQKYGNQKLNEMGYSNTKEIENIKKNYDTQQSTYKRAQFLYKNQLLSFTEFSAIENQYFTYMGEYDFIVNKKNSSNKNSLILEQNYIKNKDYIISTQNSIVYLSKEIEANKLKIALFENYKKNAIVLSTSSGTVHSIHRKMGDSLKFTENVLMVETDTKPFILVKVDLNNVSSTQLDAPCIIHSQRTNKNYKGRVAGIGYPSIDGIYVGANELAQNEVPIKIEFDNLSVRLHLNEYVNVYVLNDSSLAQNIVRFISGSFLHD
jgi:multidrug resistance efflux pump